MSAVPLIEVSVHVRARDHNITIKIQMQNCIYHSTCPALYHVAIGIASSNK